jgi:DNA-binding response OmpR family regulator
MPTVFVVAQDWMLRAGVRAELREKGIEALGMETIEDAARAIAAGQMPSAIVLESGAEGTHNTAAGQLARGVPTLVIASHVKQNEIPATAAAVLYRPASVGEIVARVLELLKGLPA